MNDEVTKLNNGEFDFVPLKFKNVKIKMKLLILEEQ